MKRQQSVRRISKAVKPVVLTVSLVVSAYLMALVNASAECAWLG